MFYKFTHLKIKPHFAEITAKKKIDEAKPGAFNQITSYKHFIMLKYSSQYLFTFAVLEYF
jgi:hypothetical protein